MNIYKVNFKYNRPVSCMQVTVASCNELKELGMEGTKAVVKWCIVDAEYEQQAIDVACTTVKQKWARWIN